ncbi:hypothetical protein ACFV0O_28855 [Kitasatospora sp. NPDC059577]|uniref:hypothetical protein n=1 Tax=unclassified Kitasatospora TaxID=2633591 RepID=UPI0036C4EDC3
MSKTVRNHRLLAVAGLAALLLTATACSSGGSGYGAPAAAPAAATPASSASSASPASSAGAPGAPGAAEGAKLVAATSAGLGPIVTDAAGRTLYRFDKDTAKPSASTCTDACAAKWPPVLTQDKVAVTGVDSELVGAVTRPDGTKQLTLGGWPLYRFAGDSAPGQTNGQGVGGTWFASTPAGKKAQAAPAQSAPAQSQSTGSTSYGY